MDSTTLQKGPQFTRRAYGPVGTQDPGGQDHGKIHAAQLEAVGLAVGHTSGSDPLQPLRVASEILMSPNSEAAVSQAREKMETAVAHHLKG